MYSANVRYVIDCVQCDFELSVTLYSASVKCDSDSEQCECEVCL